MAQEGREQFVAVRDPDADLPAVDGDALAGRDALGVVRDEDGVGVVLGGEGDEVARLVGLQPLGGVGAMTRPWSTTMTRSASWSASSR
ncbi:hypothetical protein [Streptomyces lasiicapitis]|uniref:hypothetical protein n=1 Tax=Streptomyces lasiicapitis TaxID=1923961 RepID=UPI0036B16300